jgi:4-amino-4-deoxy-L-arabinose transferase-like glycosyltransferase
VIATAPRDAHGLAFIRPDFIDPRFFADGPSTIWICFLPTQDCVPDQRTPATRFLAILSATFGLGSAVVANDRTSLAKVIAFEWMFDEAGGRVHRGVGGIYHQGSFVGCCVARIPPVTGSDGRGVRILSCDRNEAMSATGEQRWRPLSSLAFVLLVSFLGKALFRLWFSDPTTYWQSGYSFYHRMAIHLLESGQFNNGAQEGLYSCFRLPGYPAFIAGVSWLTGDSPSAFILFQSLVSTATVALVYWITSLLASHRAALASAALYAFFPYAFAHDTQLQENGLYNALSTLSVAIFVSGLGKRRLLAWMFAAGLAAGLAVLTRGTHIVPAMVLPISLWLSSSRTLSQRALMSATLLAGIAAVVGPWMMRNYAVSGRFALTSQAGMSFCVSHNSSTFDFYPYRGTIDQSWAAYHDKLPEELRPQRDAVLSDEFKAADWYRQQALTYIRQHPLETIRRGLVKILVNFAGILSPMADPVKNWTYFISFWGLTLLALAGLYELRGTSFSTVFWGLMVAQATFSFVYYAHTSHRSYLDPFLAVPAGIGLLKVVHWLNNRSSRKPSSDATQPAV